MSIADPRITAYFGDAILRAGFMPVPHVFLRHYRELGISANEAMFLLQIMETTWDLAAPPRTVGQLADRMGVDGRTIRRYTEAVVAAGLVTLYDQFDDTGAQVENGYDLSPLFRRLAEIMPEQPLAGTPRRRQPRLAHGAAPRAAAPSEADPSVRTIDTSDRQPAGISVRPPADISVRPDSDQSVRRGRRIKTSGLKAELRTSDPSIKNDDALCINRKPTQAACHTPQANGGWSLRRDCPLSAADVGLTDDVLGRIGIDLPVRSRIRATLAPDEAWSLFAYGLARHWSTGLIISQVYDKTQRMARSVSDLPADAAAVGAHLATVEPDIAERLLRVIGHHCQRVMEPSVQAELASLRALAGDAVVDAVWALMARLRGLPGATGPRTTPTSTAQPPAPQAEGQIWDAVLALLKAQTPPAEFETWLHCTTLLSLEPERVVIGTPHVFAREQVEQTYRPAIDLALHGVIGRHVSLDIVVGG